MRRKTNISGHIEEAPWYVFLIDRLACHVCDWIPPIPFPPVATRNEDGEVTTWREYWGDFRQWWHCVVHDPMFKWTAKRIKTIR